MGSGPAQAIALIAGYGQQRKARDWCIAGLAEIRKAQQTAGVSETNENARRWNGYVCPVCRLVFRVPRDHDGRGLVCQSCRSLLRIPAAGEPTPPLLAEIVKTAGIAPQPTATTSSASSPAAPSDTLPLLRGSRQGGRKRHSSTTATDGSVLVSWDRKHSGRVSSGRRERRSMRWMLGGGLALFALVAGGGWLASQGGGGLARRPPRCRYHPKPSRRKRPK